MSGRDGRRQVRIGNLNFIENPTKTPCKCHFEISAMSFGEKLLHGKEKKD
jgi:hypothetical protein